MASNISSEKSETAGHTTGETSPLLSVQGLTASYGDVQVLWGIDLAVQEGSIVSVVGSNGAGKTTLLLAISGMVAKGQGSVTFAGEDISRLPPDEIVKRRLAHVPEGRRLFKTLSVKDNLLLGAYGRTDHAEVARDLDFVFSIFPILKERSHQDATTMSGGQQQMCAIGRGIMARPRLLLIDELSLGLAPRVVEELAECLVKINAEGISILLVEQDVMTAFEIAQYAYVIESGRVRLHGQSSELMNDPVVQSAYLGM